MDSAKERLFTFAGLAAIIAGIYLLSDISGSFSRITDEQKTIANSAMNEIKRLDDVLNRKIDRDTFQYKGSFESPFRFVGEDLSPRKRNPFANLPPRPKLFLKGILKKNVPLAILEDEKGQTYIQGVGEKVLDQEIVKISNTSVTLRDPRGIYDLTVQEN